MLRRSIRIAIAIALIGCGGGGGAPQGRTTAAAGQQATGNRQQATGNAETEKRATGNGQRATGNAEPEPPAQPEPLPPPEPEVLLPLVIPNDYVAAKGKRTMLVQDKAVSVGRGLRIKIAAAGHKHLVGGGAVGFYELTLKRGARTESIRYSVDDESDEAEIDALGVLVVLKSTNDGIEVTSIGKTPKPLDEDAAAEMIVKAAEKKGLPAGSGAGYSTANGVMTYVSMDEGKQRWRGRIGIYTRRLWFLPPAPEVETGL